MNACGFWAFAVVVVADRAVAEEDAEHAAGALDDVRHAGPASASATAEAMALLTTSSRS